MSSTPVETLKEKIKEAREQLKLESADILAKEFAALFRDYSKLDSIAWHQYTPGFNDGDTCYFTVNNDWEFIKVNGISQTDDYGEYTTFEDWQEEVAQHVEGILNPLIDSYAERSSGQGLELLKAIFGDNTEVTFKRDGTFEQDSYDCGY